ncbi:MAG: hypothetical protein U9R34_01860 [Nanoarchaeota archaeon]|nr:hypothetical protein [Nanoarchaeota archaeon]
MKKNKADVVFDEIFGLLTDNDVNKENAEKITKDFIQYLRDEKNLNPADIDDYFEGLLSKNSIDEEDTFEIMEIFSMMSDMCINSCNKCFSDLDGDGTLISLSNKGMDENEETDEPMDEQIEIYALLNKARHVKNVEENDKKAIEICDQILQMDQDNLDALLIKAGSLNLLQKNKESLKLINYIKDKWPEHWEAYYLLGLHLFNKNERKALQALKKSLQLDENFNNLVTAAQLAYFMDKSNYQEYLDKAEKLDSERFKNFMEKYWSYDLN